ncbi:MAG: AI-2E family transporter, partial [Eubacteriales bacterium]|nr:AI-2E family transporter [Eubacteriales bacterium]
GNLATGIGLAVLYVVVIVVRQIIEPKIIGDRVGLHPIVTLLSMVLGTYLFGGIGLFGLPISVALIHALQREGAIHLYKIRDDEPTTGTAEYEATPAASAPPTADPPATKKKPRKPKS